MFNVDYFMNALPVMGKGMLSIFIVTAVIVAVVYLLNALPAMVDGIAGATYKALTKNKK